jgi:hypothetical protein
MLLAALPRSILRKAVLWRGTEKGQHRLARHGVPENLGLFCARPVAFGSILGRPRFPRRYRPYLFQILSTIVVRVKIAKQIKQQRRNNPRIGGLVKQDKHISGHRVGSDTTDKTADRQSALQIILEFSRSVESFYPIADPPGDSSMNKLNQFFSTLH